MFDLFGHSPSVGSYRHDPMTADEIDAHPDCDRIWATISAMQDGAEAARQDGYEEAEGDIRAAVEEAISNCEFQFEEWLEDILEKAEEWSRSQIIDVLTETDARSVLW